jgi:hypothetical protein
MLEERIVQLHVSRTLHARLLHRNPRAARDSAT